VYYGKVEPEEEATESQSRKRENEDHVMREKGVGPGIRIDFGKKKASGCSGKEEGLGGGLQRKKGVGCGPRCKKKGKGRKPRDFAEGRHHLSPSRRPRRLANAAKRKKQREGEEIERWKAVSSLNLPFPWRGGGGRDGG